MLQRPTLKDFTVWVVRTDCRPESEKLLIAVFGVFGELGLLMSEVNKGVWEDPAYTSFRI